MLKFFHHPLSPYSRKVHFFLEESGHPYEIVPVSLEKGENKTADYLEQNPYGRVPAIDDRGFKLSESNAILRYLSGKWERFDLYPAHPEERAHVDMWMEYLSNHLTRPLLDLAWNRYYAEKYGRKPDAYAIDHAESRLLREFPVLEKHLQGRNWFVGPEATLADLVLAPFMALSKVGAVNLSDFPSVRAWSDKVCQRPAWKRVAAT